MSDFAHRYDHAAYPEAATQAERFVDDTTWLRMTRLRMPLADTQIAGVTSDLIKQIHLANATFEKWAHGEDNNTPWQGVVDIALRFPDGSLAIRIAATQRWEVMRTWL